MGAAFRRLFLSIGVALGLAQGQPDPTIVARAYVEDGALLVSARVENAFAPGAVELVEAGTKVAMRFSARFEGTDGREASALETRSIWYDFRTGRYGVSFDGDKAAALVDPGAARTLASEVAALALLPARATGGEAEEGRVLVDAVIGIVNSRGEWHEAPVLWNYVSPAISIELHKGK